MARFDPPDQLIFGPTSLASSSKAEWPGLVPSRVSSGQESSPNRASRCRKLILRVLVGSARTSFSPERRKLRAPQTCRLRSAWRHARRSRSVVSICSCRGDGAASHRCSESRCSRSNVCWSQARTQGGAIASYPLGVCLCCRHIRSAYMHHSPSQSVTFPRFRFHSLCTT